MQQINTAIASAQRPTPLELLIAEIDMRVQFASGYENNIGNFPPLLEGVYRQLGREQALKIAETDKQNQITFHQQAQDPKEQDRLLDLIKLELAIWLEKTHSFGALRLTGEQWLNLKTQIEDREQKSLIANHLESKNYSPEEISMAFDVIHHRADPFVSVKYELWMEEQSRNLRIQEAIREAGRYSGINPASESKPSARHHEPALELR